MSLIGVVIVLLMWKMVFRLLLLFVIVVSIEFMVLLFRLML